MWIAVLAGCLAMAMILGPVMMLQPSSRQRELAKLRTLASQLGMRVQIITRQSQKGSDKIAAYSLLLPSLEDKGQTYPSWLVEKTQLSHGVHFHGYWDWEDECDNCPIEGRWLKLFLDSLPDTIVTVGQNDRLITVFWRERWPKDETPEDALKKVHGYLEALSSKVKPGV